MDSEDATSWLGRSLARAAFLGRFAPNATFKSRTYSLVVQFVPLHFKPDDSNELRTLEGLNGFPINAFLRACWIKPLYCREAEQTCRHMLAVMTRPEDVNKLLTDSLIEAGLCLKMQESTYLLSEVPWLGTLILQLSTALQYLRDVCWQAPDPRMQQPGQTTLRIMLCGRTSKLGLLLSCFPR